jgi:hypothetical protein
MGIRNFFKVVPVLFPSCRLRFRATPASRYAHVLLDVNNFLHGGASTSHARFVQEAVRQSSKLLLRAVVATDSLYFAVDGATPAAKLVLQRARRSDEADSLRKDLFFYGPRDSCASSIEISPGTELMLSVFDALCYSACAHLTRASTRLAAPHVAVHVDGSSSPGEGEFKMFRHIAATPPSAGDAARALVFSGDSDVVLLGLLSRRRNIDIMRDATLGFSVDALRAAIAARFGCAGAAELERVVDDFVLFTLLSGSDFTPAVQHYSLADTLERYARMRAADRARFVYDRVADAIDVGALVECVATAPRPPEDGAKSAAPFADRFGALVRGAGRQGCNAASYLQTLQWCLSYMAGHCVNDRLFCKQLDNITVDEIADWARRSGTTRTPAVPRRAPQPLLPVASLIAVCPLRYAEVVPAPLRALHADVWRELERATGAAYADASLDVSPVTRVLDSLNERVLAAVGGADVTRYLRSVTTHAPVSVYSRDASGNHLYAWPRIPNVLPEQPTRTGIRHRLAKQQKQA